MDGALDYGQKAQKDRLSGQKKLFATPESTGTPGEQEDVSNTGEWPDRQKWAFEKEALGYYVTGHPLQEYQEEIARFGPLSADQLTEEISGREVCLCGVITAIRQLRTRKGDSMASFRLEDLSGTVEVLVWPKSFEKHRSLMKPDQPVMVRGRYEFDAKGDGRVLCSELIHLDTLWEQAVHKTRIRIALPSVSPQNLSKLHALLNDYQGKMPTRIRVTRPRPLSSSGGASGSLAYQADPTLHSGCGKAFWGGFRGPVY